MYESISIHKQNFDRELAGWLAGWRNYDQGTCHALGWLAGWLRGWLAGRVPERPKEAQRGGAWIELACHALGWRLPTSRFTYVVGLPTDRFLNGTPEVARRRTTIGVPNRNPLQTQGLPATRITTRELPHKQNYDQGGSAQAEL